MNFLTKNVKRLKMSDFVEIAPLHLGVTYSFLLSELKTHKLARNTKNLALLIESIIKDSDASPSKIILTAASLELEYIERCCKNFEWQAHHLLKSSSQSDIDFPQALHRAIRSKGLDAEVIYKSTSGLLWISVLYKDLEILGIFEAPIYLTISSDLTYMFTKKNMPNKLVESIIEATHSKKIRTIKLSGRDVPSLLKALKATKNPQPRPQFGGGSTITNKFGTDYTRRIDCKKYADECLQPNLDISRYFVQSADRQWEGDDTPEFQLLDLPSEVIFTGDVTRILAQLAVTDICRPPFPSYIRDFTVQGRSLTTVSRLRKDNRTNTIFPDSTCPDL